MQDVTPWPESFDVSEPVARVLVDGREVDVESVTVSSELDSAMPERVAAGGGGVVAATGTASILRSDDVAEAGFNPWGDAEQLVNASEVVVEAGYRDPATGGVGCVRQITAQVESLSGSARDIDAGMRLVDHTPTLDRDITIEPLLDEYPPLEDRSSLSGPQRRAGLISTYVTDRVLRHCGFYATPPLLSGAVMSAPMMGSTVPERGVFVSSRSVNDAARSADFRRAPWGVGLGSSVVSYHPDFGSRSHGRLTSALQVSVHRDMQPGALYHSNIDLRWDYAGSHGIRVQMGADGYVQVAYRTDSIWQSVVVMPPSVAVGAESFSVIVTPQGRATIYASNGETRFGVADLPAVVTSQNMEEVLVTVPEASHTLGGVQVAFNGTPSHIFERNAHLDPPAHPYSLEAFPSQIGVNCLSLLKEQAEAELAAMWIDERGHFQWRNRHMLRGSAPVGELTSERNLFDIPWDVPVRSVFSRVEIEHQVPTVTRRVRPSITVSDNRGSTLENSETEDRFFEPPADQDWHQVAAPQWMGGSPDLVDIRRGRGSYRGGVILDADNNERLAYSSRLIQQWSQINPQRWLLHSEAHNLDSDESIEQSFLDRPDWYGRFAGENLPIIRAKGLTEWDTQKIVGTSVGPEFAPVFLHQVGPWIQPMAGGAQELQSLADWLAEELTKPAVMLRDVPIVPDPRVQLGDVFWLKDDTAYGVRLKIVVMGKTLTYQASNSGHEMTQQITCRILEAQQLHQ